MKFIIFALCFLALLNFSKSDMACKVYYNQTVLGSLCKTPNYKIAPLIDFLNSSKTDDVSKEVQKYYKEVSKQVDETMSYIPSFMRSSDCFASVNNLMCGSVLRRCEVVSLPDLSSGQMPTDFKLDISSYGSAACMEQCEDVADKCVGTYLKMIPVAGTIMLQTLKSWGCYYVEQLKIDVDGKTFKLLDKTTNCTSYQMYSGASSFYPPLAIAAVLAFLLVF